MALALVHVALGYRSYQTQLPNSDKVTDCQGNSWAGVGHLRPGGGGPRNQFGIDFQAAGYTWTTALCQQDSDGDGVTNGVELGDPSCTWTPGATPQFDTGITHPGLDCGSLNCDGSPNTAGASAPHATVGCANYSAPTIGYFDLTFAGHAVAPGTSYIKGSFTWPGTVRAAVLRFEFINHNPDVVHHMILYRCPTDMASQFGTPTTGGTMGCTDVLMAWAVGGGPICAPPALAFVVDPAAPYFLLEMHYDNARNTPGIVDTSGMRLHFVPHASSGLDAISVVLSGASLPRISVPPLRSSYRATVTITSAMLGMPSNYRGVELFAVIEHMHGIGRKIWLTMVDDTDASDTTEVSCNTNYDFDLQEAKYLSAPLLLPPGKKLQLDCVYDSSARNYLTHGGDETHDEMCIIVLFYAGPEAANSLISPIVTLDSGSGAHTCGFTEQMANANANCTGYGSGGLGLDDDGYDYDRAVRMLELHGGLMLWAWGLLLPMGAVVPRFWRDVLGPKWLYLHLTLQLSGIAFVLAGLWASIDATNARLQPHFDVATANGHKLFGLVVVILSAVQLLGLVRPHKAAAGEQPTIMRQLWSWSHRLGGIAAIGLAVAQVLSGSDQIKMFTDSLDGARTTYFAMLGCAVAFGCLGFGLGKLRPPAGKSAGFSDTEMPKTSAINTSL